MLAVAACGGSNPDLKAARHSGYKADFAIVFNAVVKVVRSRFKNFPDKVQENAASGTIETAWMQVRTTTEGEEDHTTTQQQRDLAASQQRAQGNDPVFRGSSDMRVVYLVRYQVYVVGGNPWRVIVQGKAAKFTEGDTLHVELKGADRPSWLDGRVENMEVDIYRALKRYAVEIREPVNNEARPPPTPSDLARYGKIPAPAAAAVEEVRRAAEDRDFPRLR
ncbi:MAG TPA: hypothetical protein VL172_05670, partial [Kofleriaceae bacterium]|nr:hypothetical protein [Kofleriaceae bacterium]